VTRKGHIYSLDLKCAAVERMQQGENLSTLARELGVKRRLLYEWRRIAAEGRPLRQAGRPRTHDRLPDTGIHAPA
jgi:transposase-like protein